MNCLINRRDGMKFEAREDTSHLFRWWTVVHVMFPNSTTMYFDAGCSPWKARKLRNAFEEYKPPFEVGP